MTTVTVIMASQPEERGLRFYY